VLNITQSQAEFVNKTINYLQNRGFRVQGDLRNEKIGFKIREHTIQRVPYLLVVGDREVLEEKVSVRSRDGVDFGSMSLEAFAEKLGKEIAQLGRLEE
jgi:threonyl-tRNA synthetase